MSLKMIAMDLDGTTVNRQGHLGEKTKAALTRARSRGNRVVFATGRRDIDMFSFWTESRYADYLLLNNGGKLIRTADNAVLFNRTILPEPARAQTPWQSVEGSMVPCTVTTPMESISCTASG